MDEEPERQGPHREQSGNPGSADSSGNPGVRGAQSPQSLRSRGGLPDFCSSKPSRNGAATDNGAGAAGHVREHGQKPGKEEESRILVLRWERR